MTLSDATAKNRMSTQLHGGDLDRARALFGGAADAWLDLSTGINAAPYPAPPAPLEALTRLPDAAQIQTAENAARGAYGAPPEADVIAAAGAQAVIDAAPRLRGAGVVAIVGPTYTEHAIAFQRAGWRVRDVSTLEEADAADALVIVNPNNPTGRRFQPKELRAALRPDRLLIIDESFADVTPEISVAAQSDQAGLLVLRSFGKFYGLAGLRLGFALCSPQLGAALRAQLGPWSVSGPALAIGAAALRDLEWRAAEQRRLAEAAARLDALAGKADWRLLGGCDLFRCYDVRDAATEQNRLAVAHIWTRRFDHAPTWLRLGLPGDEPSWARLAAALEG